MWLPQHRHLNTSGSTPAPKWSQKEKYQRSRTPLRKQNWSFAGDSWQGQCKGCTAGHWIRVSYQCNGELIFSERKTTFLWCKCVRVVAKVNEVEGSEIGVGVEIVLKTVGRDAHLKSTVPHGTILVSPSGRDAHLKRVFPIGHAETFPKKWKTVVVRRVSQTNVSRKIAPKSSKSKREQSVKSERQKKEATSRWTGTTST